MDTRNAGFASLILALLILATVTGWVHADTNSSQVVRDHRKIVLDLNVVTPSRLQGVLRKGKIGLRFDSHRRRQDFFYLITTLDGRLILSGRSEGGNVVSAFGDQATAKSKRADLETFRAEAEVAPASDKAKISRRQALQPLVAEKLLSITDVQGNLDAVQQTIASPEYALLPTLSDQLAQAGMIGNLYRPSFALHAVGMGATTLLGMAPASQPGFLARQKLPPRIRPFVTGKIGDLLAPPNISGFCWNKEDGANLEQLPQCPPDQNQCNVAGRDGPAGDEENGCYGRCGPGCTCWSSLCGDCCFNDKCAVHDAITRKCSWNPTSWAACVVAGNPTWLVGFGCS
ncbi:hypothetical protein [Mesorhizobium helmanticense]|uniref:hypothetical protein n=1 Tax=Mesorhizobium helmanticense TaxID=1776423 RepID=UPI0011B21CCC|nr:hypothetical protein [Mesorhizobium helmanticense]